MIYEKFNSDDLLFSNDEVVRLKAGIQFFQDRVNYEFDEFNKNIENGMSREEAEKKLSSGFNYQYDRFKERYYNGWTWSNQVAKNFFRELRKEGELKVLTKDALEQSLRNAIERADL